MVGAVPTAEAILMTVVGDVAVIVPSPLVATAVTLCVPTVKPLAAESTMAAL